MPHRASSWTQGHTSFVLIIVAMLAILLTITTLVDLIKQNVARGDALRARLANPDRVMMLTHPRSSPEQVATNLP